MARKRMIDPSIWQSEDFAKLSTLAKLVFIGMFSNADDSGRGRAKSVYLKSIIFPYDEDLRVADIDKTLDEIASNMSVIFYRCDENEYYELNNWQKWQKVDKPQGSKIPPLSDECEIIRRMFGEESGNTRRTVSPNRIEKNGKEEKGKEAETRAPAHGDCCWYYQNRIGMVNPTIAGDIASFETIMPSDLINAAIDEAARNNARWSYARAILSRCRDHNILTLDAFRADQISKKQKEQAPPRRKTAEELLRERGYLDESERS